MAKGTSRVGKNDLVGTVAGTTELTKENTKKVVNAVLDGIFSVLKQTGQLQLTKFGTFSVRKTKGRQGRNPATGQPITIPPGYRLGFKVSKVWKTDRFPVSKTGLRRRREEAEHAPIRLRYWDRGVNNGPDDGSIDLSSIVVELPLSELARLLSQRFAVRLYNYVRKLLEIPEGPCFPYPLADVVRNRSLLSALRAKLAHIKNLSELIADPPAILIEERRKLFFYRGVPVMLRPVSFSYLLLLAQTPREFVMREEIYSRLWPGEMDYEGSNKPYERQITDHKRKLIAEIRKGITGRVEIQEGEVESLIATRHKMGYMLNFARENVLILRKRDFGVIAFLLLSEMDRFFSDLLLDTPELLFLW